MTSTINETEVYRMLDQITELKAKLARQEQLLNSVAKSYDEKLTQAYMSGGIKESTRRIIKEWQLFAGEKATENGLIAEQLEFTVRIAQEWQARAEAAEKRVQELEAQLLGFEMAQETLVIDLRRIAERIGNPQDEWYGFGPIVENIHTGITKLESQLAAQAWRPVTEPPGVDDYYIVECRYEDDDLRYVMPARYSDGEWVSIKTELPLIGNVIRYHSLPPAATE